MPAARLEIDKSTILDNVDERQVEFEAEVDGDEHQFAVHYDVLEALTGDAPDDNAGARSTSSSTPSLMQLCQRFVA